MGSVFLLLKELLVSLRDIKTTLLMILMPTMLTVLLSFVFKEEFDIETWQNSKEVYIHKSVKESNYLIYEKIKELLEKSDFNLILDYESKEVDSKIIIVLNENNEIEVLFDSNNRAEGYIITSLLKNYLHLNSVSDFEEITKESSVKLKSLSKNVYSSSLDYYGVTMVTLTILFSAVTGAYKVVKERNDGTLKKLLTMPISYLNILIGKIIGVSLIAFLQIVVTIIISKNFIGVNWGNNYSLVIILLLIECILAVSMGTLVGTFLKDNKSCWLVLLSIIMGFGLVGGSFIPLEMFRNKTILFFSNISPIKLVNESIFNLIYFNNYTYFVRTMILLLLIIVTIIYLASLRREKEI